MRPRWEYRGSAPAAVSENGAHVAAFSTSVGTEGLFVVLDAENGRTVEVLENAGNGHQAVGLSHDRFLVGVHSSSHTPATLRLCEVGKETVIATVPDGADAAQVVELHGRTSEDSTPVFARCNHIDRKGEQVIAEFHARLEGRWGKGMAVVLLTLDVESLNVVERTVRWEPDWLEYVSGPHRKVMGFGRDGALFLTESFGIKDIGLNEPQLEFAMTHRNGDTLAIVTSWEPPERVWPLNLLPNRPQSAVVVWKQVNGAPQIAFRRIGNPFGSLRPGKVRVARDGRQMFVLRSDGDGRNQVLSAYDLD